MGLLWLTYKLRFVRSLQCHCATCRVRRRLIPTSRTICQDPTAVVSSSVQRRRRISTILHGGCIGLAAGATQGAEDADRSC